MNHIDQLFNPKNNNVTPKDIREVLNRRSDLSTFIVHLTKDKDSLESIIKSWTIEARSMWGLAKNKGLKDNTTESESQKCVCFTETPIEYLYLMTDPIKDRKFQPGPYGIAITKKLAREKGVNPVWYIDISPDNERDKWLTKPIENLIEQAKISQEGFTKHPIAQITPFIEPMGSGRNSETGKAYRYEFWWEREWRHVENFDLPNHIILLCPDKEIDYFEGKANYNGHSARAIDPNWGLEKIIARLAGFKDGDIDPL